MILLNVNVPQDRISMIFDPYINAESCSTTLYLHKSNVVFEEEENKYSAKLEIDLDKNPKKDKMLKQTLVREYGTFIISFLNADFSDAENAYNSFFVFYGLEGLNNIDKIRQTYPFEYTSRYVSTKKFLDYYNKAFRLVQKDYIKFQKDIRNTVDFVFNLHENNHCLDLDKVPKFLAYSTVVDLLGQFYSILRFSIIEGYSLEDLEKLKNNKDIENLAYEIANKELNNTNPYLYESTSHFALAYVALNDLIRNSKRNISICQNCGRYFLQKSGKEIYCELPNLDGSPSCKSYASRKTYDNKITEDIAELTYKREYQRKITQVYRADNSEKATMKKDFASWKSKARIQLKQYRDGNERSSKALMGLVMKEGKGKINPSLANEKLMERLNS